MTSSGEEMDVQRTNLSKNPNLPSWLITHRIFLTFGVVYFLVGFTVGLYMISEGIGVSPDSVAYIASARSLVTGDGLSVPNGIDEPSPMTHFGPLYPGLLAMFGFLGLDVVIAAKFLSALFLGALLFIATGLVYYATPKGSVAFLLAPLLILASEDILEIHRYAFSEPLFFVLTSLGLFAFTKYLQVNTKEPLIGALGFLGLAALTRYAGLAVVPTLFLGLILFRKTKFLKRLLGATTISLLAAFPLAFWFLRNWIRTGNPTNRGFAFHPISVGRLRAGLATVSDWFLPGRITGNPREFLTAVVLVGVFLIFIYTLYNARKKMAGGVNENRDLILPAMFGLYILCYTAMLIVTISFIDAQLSLTPRPLSPIYLLGVITLLSVLPSSFKRSARIIPGVITAGILFILAFNSVHAVKFVSRAHAGSMMMYAGEGWQEAAIIQQVRRLPEGIPIYSNGNDAVYFVAGKPAARLPQKVDPFTLETDPSYRSEMDRMRNILADSEGVIIYFDGITWRGYLPSRQEVEAALPLVVEWIGDEGVIYRLQ